MPLQKKKTKARTGRFPVFIPGIKQL